MAESRKSFWGFRMPQTHNANQGMKDALNRGDYDWAEKCADAQQESLQKALEETNEAIRQRDKGNKRSRDPDVKDGIRY